jgi:hypothetical protein
MQLGLLRGTPPELQVELKLIQDLCLKNIFTSDDINQIAKNLHKMRQATNKI